MRGWVRFSVVINDLGRGAVAKDGNGASFSDWQQTFHLRFEPKLPPPGPPAEPERPGETRR
jgi:hypothetical protein